MQEAGITANEEARISTLHNLKILDTLPEERFDRITRITARVFAVPIALVSLIDTNRQWIKSCVGLNVSELPRRVSFCAHAILKEEILIIQDTHLDTRFADNPLVTGEPFVRFYAGFPLSAADGTKLGTLCIIDHGPHAFNDTDRQSFIDLARWAEIELSQIQELQVERLRTQEELRNTDYLYRTLVEYGQGLICSHDLAGNLLSINSAAAHSLGYEPDELVGRSLREFLAPSTQHLLDPYLQQCKENTVVRGLLRLRTRTGEERIWLYQNVRYTQRGQPLCVLGHALDVTEQEQVKKALRESEARFRSLTESAKEAIIIADSQGTIQSWNRGAHVIFGYEEKEVLGQPITILLAERHHAGVEKAIATYRTGGEALFEDSAVEIQALRKDGTEFPLELSLATWRTRTGNFVSGIGRDISARKAAESALRESEERFRRLSEATFEGIVFDEQSRIINANQSAALMFGYSIAEMIGMSVLDFVLPADRAISLEQIRVRNEAPYELSCVRRDGSRFPAEFQGKVIPYQRRTVRVVAIRDITERKRYEAALFQANEELTRSVQRLEQRTREVTLLNEMGELLQTCETAQEAYQVIKELIGQLLPTESGALCILKASQNFMETLVSWGEKTTTEIFLPSDCWAVRRGRIHVVTNPHSNLRCQHTTHQREGVSLCVPLLAQGDPIGILHVQSMQIALEKQHAEEITSKERLVVTLAEHIALALANLQLREILRNQAIRDQLTNLFNRRYLEETLKREILRAGRSHSSVGIIMIDIDHFKHFNDTFGHQVGDALLKVIGQFLQAAIRSEDIACRYGGEEFIVIMPEASLAITAERAERLREHVKDLQIQDREQSLGTITLSLGVACFPHHGSNGEKVIREADVALYQAKQEGRDRVKVANTGQE